MVARWKNKWRWAVPGVVMMVAAGCSKMESPKAKGKSDVRDQLAAAGIASNYASNFEKTCQELPGMVDVPVLVSLDEYSQLIEFVKAGSPLLRNDTERFLRAHSRALRASNEDVMWLLDKNQKTQELISFRRNVARFVRYSHPNPAMDLQVMLGKVMEINEGGKCAGAYLSHFYANFIKELDPFGEITFGLTESRAPEDTSLLQPVLPDEIRLAAPARMQGSVLVVTLSKLQRSPLLDGVLRALEQGAIQQTYHAILFDVRYGGGLEVPVIAQLRASAAKGWGALPVTIFTSNKTRGIAALLAQQFSSHPNVQVIGTDDETYGFGRKLIQQSSIAPGLSPFTVTVGSEFLQPLGFDSAGDGYRLRLDKDAVVVRTKNKDVLELAIEKADQWGGRAPLGDLGQMPVAPATADSGNVVNADAQAAASAQVAEAAAVAAGIDGAGTPIMPPGEPPQADPGQNEGGTGSQGSPPGAPDPVVIQPPADLPVTTAKSDAPPMPF